MNMYFDIRLTEGALPYQREDPWFNSREQDIFDLFLNLKGVV